MSLLAAGGERSVEECSPPFLLRAAVERARVLSECLALLPARARLLVAMRYGAAMSLEEAGAVLGISESGAARAERRVLAALRRELARRGVTRFDEV